VAFCSVQDGIGTESVCASKLFDIDFEVGGAAKDRFAPTAAIRKSDEMEVSASHPTSDMRRLRHHVRKVPNADILAKNRNADIRH
jgi:hypothetical protein